MRKGIPVEKGIDLAAPHDVVCCRKLGDVSHVDVDERRRGDCHGLGGVSHTSIERGGVV